MYDVPIFKERKKRIAKCNKDYRCFIERSKSSTSSTGCSILKTLKVNALSSKMVNKLFDFWLHAAFNTKMFWEIVLYFDDLESFIVCTIFLKKLYQQRNGNTTMRSKMLWSFTCNFQVKDPVQNDGGTLHFSTSK